jgi:hypothetical protein
MAKHARWGDCCRWRTRGKRKKYFWTPERDAVLRERYDSHVRNRTKEIGRAFGWPGWVINRRARELGLAAPRAKWQAWTADEVSFLEAHAGVRHVVWISRKLRRPLTSVILKLKRLRISRRVREGYGMRDLEECLGIDHRRITQLVDSGKLKAEHRAEHPRDRWTFTDAGVIEFMRRYPNAFRLDRVDQLWFLDLVFKGRIGNAGREEAAA